MLEQALKKKKARGGRPNKLTPEEMVSLTLEYLREYQTYFHISKNYGISESNCYYAMRFAEDTLIQSGKFSLPGKKALLTSEVEHEIVLIDASESPIARPQKTKTILLKQKNRHTLKTQLILDKYTKTVICNDFSKGNPHDFKLFKDSKVCLREQREVIVDSGYQGINKLHNKKSIPKKQCKKHPLNKTEKKNNQQLSGIRVFIENVLGMLKLFKILAERYRNRRKRFGLRFNLIAGIYNIELAC